MATFAISPYVMRLLFVGGYQSRGICCFHVVHRVDTLSEHRQDSQLEEFG